MLLFCSAISASNKVIAVCMHTKSEAKSACTKKCVHVAQPNITFLVEHDNKTLLVETGHCFCISHINASVNT